MAFPMAAAIAGWIAGESRGIARTVAGLVLASAMIFILGAGWLAALTDLSAAAIVAAAVTPFLFGAAVKVGLALVVTRPLAARF